MAATNNAVGGKGPCGSHAEGGGKREGMAGEIWPKHPEEDFPSDKVRQLQERPGKSAKRNPKRRFHALYDCLFRPDILKEAWNRVRANHGAAGVDRGTIAAVEERGVEILLAEIHVALREGEYRPPAVLRRYIPKADGKLRPLGIPTVRDRVVQAAAKIVLEPIFEADFRPCSHSFRPERSTTMAPEALRKQGAGHGGNQARCRARTSFACPSTPRLVTFPSTALLPSAC